MPNHVINVWKIKNLKPEDVSKVMNRLTCEYTVEGEVKRIIDFDLIIPEPRFIQDCPKKYRVNKDSRVKAYVSREWFNWYDWHLHFWGTKWNAYDGYTKVGKTYIQMVFNTAWSFPEEIANELMRLGYNLEIKFADECCDYNCGKITYNAETGELTTLGGKEIPNYEEFGHRLWNQY